MDRRQRIRWALAGLWTGAILAGSSLPGGSVPLPGNTDKLAHFGEYLVLGVLVGRALHADAGRRAIAVALLALAAFGALDEAHQALIPGRIPDVLDWTADATGTTLGLLAFRWLRLRRAGASSPPPGPPSA